MITPDEFVRKLNTEWSRGTMIESLFHAGP